MTTDPYKIEVIKDPEALTALTAAQYASFINTDNVLHHVLFPPDSPPSPAQIDLAAARHKAAFSSDPEHVVYIQILDPANGKIMGAAKWQFWPHDPKRPLTYPINYVDDSTPEGKAEKALAQKVMDEFQGRRARDMAMPHGLLDLCFTTPEYERRGVATALVKWGLEKVDKEGWPAFTEASPRGWPVYAKLGFERTEVVKLRFDEMGDYARNLGDVVWNYMVRPARRKE